MGGCVLDSISGIGREFTLGFWVMVGTVGFGVTWIKLGLVLMVGVRIVVLPALFLVRFKLFKWLSYGEVDLAIQARSAVHVGVDNFNVFRHFGRICDEVDPVKLFLILMDDGDLLALKSEMVQKRGNDTTRVAEVKGHATEAMVRSGHVSDDDQFGNKMADGAAELGRRRVDPGVVD